LPFTNSPLPLEFIYLFDHQGAAIAA